MELQSRPLFVIDIKLHPPQMHVPTALGERKIQTIESGSFAGERLRGTILPHAAADWALIRSDGVLVLDVRLTLQTDDGERIYMTYSGLRHGPPETMARMARGEVIDPAEYYFRIAPLFEAPAGRYDWLNKLLAIGIGARLKDGPRYIIFEIL